MIPLFFIISGFLLKTTGSLPSFIRKVIIRYAIPWLGLPLIPVLLEGVVKRNPHYIIDYYFQIMTGEKIWFMPVMIGSMIIYYGVQKLVKNNSGGGIALSIIIFVIGNIMIYLPTINILSANRMLICQLFLLIGYCLRQYEACKISYYRVCHTRNYKY